MARGYWTRLYARSFYFEDHSGNRLALVSCDLFAVPEALHAAVAYRLRHSGITPAEIVVAAQHTHQGPGNYLSAAIHNDFGSRWPGFSRDLFDFFGRRIADGIQQAIDDARKKPRDTDLVIHTGRLKALVMSRSPRAFLLNDDRDEIMRALNPSLPSDPEACLALKHPLWPQAYWEVFGCPRLRAVDNSLRVLEIKRGPDRVGLIALTNVHPTVLHHDAEVYSSDFVGLAATQLELLSSKLLIVGIFSGATGHSVAQRTDRDFFDVGRLAERLADSIRQTADGTGQPVFEGAEKRISVRFRSLDPRSVAPESGGGSSPLALARKPMFGVATVGGAEEDRSPLYRLGWEDGVTGIAKDGQGPKQPGLDSPILPSVKVTDIAAPPWKFPRRLPITFAQIGSIGIATTSVELTPAMANRVRQEVQAGTSISSLLLIGLANDYANYATTPEEYVGQEYEAASTIWGPNEGPLLARRLADLAGLPMAETMHRPSLRVEHRWFQPGLDATPAFGPRFAGDARRTPLDGLEDEITDDTQRPARRLPWCQWTEGGDAIRKACKRAGGRQCDLDPDFLAANQRSARVETRDGDSWKASSDPDSRYPDDDVGGGVATILLDGRSDARLWSAVWLRPARVMPAGTYRFRVTTAEGIELCSAPFEIPLPANQELPIRICKCGGENGCPYVDTSGSSPPGAVPGCAGSHCM